MFPEFHSLSEFLIWAASGPGALVVAGFFASYVLERFAVWHKLAHDLKSALVVALAVGVSYGAKSLLSVEIVSNAELNQLFALILFYASSQFGYKRYFELK